MFNLNIREAMKVARVKGYEVAAALGIAETSFSRSIARKEIDNAMKAKIFEVIQKMKGR